MEHPQLDSGDWARLERRLSGAAVLELSAHEHNVPIRRRGVRDAAGLSRLSLMYGPGRLTPDEQVRCKHGFPRIKHTDFHGKE
jgi:hypothetical protein